MTDADRGVAIVVWRRAPRIEVLLLHRSIFGAAALPPRVGPEMYRGVLAYVSVS